MTVDNIQPKEPMQAVGPDEAWDDEKILELVCWIEWHRVRDLPLCLEECTIRTHRGPKGVWTSRILEIPGVTATHRSRSRAVRTVKRHALRIIEECEEPPRRC